MTRLGAMLRRDLPPEDLTAIASAAAPGLDELWIVEDLNWLGGIAQMSAVLDATDNDAAGRPVVGHGIAPAPFRNPAALAMEWATLARRHPGRVIGGIGHGLPSWMRQLGESVDSPLTLLRETIEATQQILAGGKVSYRGRYVAVDDVELVFPPTEPISVLAGVTGPRSLELSGEIADGTVLAEGFDPEQIVGVREAIDRGRERAGRTDPHNLTVFVGFYAGDLSELPPPPPDIPDGWAVVGPDNDSVVDDLQAVIDTGVDSLVLIPFGPTEAQLTNFVREIAPRLHR
jgi:5,10-methylenetetrahydromethanopterin reductase